MKSLLKQAVEKALQLDFFNDLFSTEKSSSEQAEPPATPKALAPVNSPDPAKTPNCNKRKITLSDQILEYSLLRSTRRSIGFLINQEGLRVTAPRWVTITDIELAIQEKQRWILTKLSERHARQERRVQTAMRWEDGATFLYLGTPVTLRIFHAARNYTYFDDVLRELQLTFPATAGNTIADENSEDKIRIKIKLWLQQQARQIFSARMPVYAEKLGVRYQSLSLSNATTRWGSCTSQGKIRLNWRLIHFAPELIDYVIAHELSHLHEMNHGPRFWAHVQAVFPDFALVKLQLRHHATADLPVL
jgi:predicted metal-dependent hydrolase